MTIGNCSKTLLTLGAVAMMSLFTTHAVNADIISTDGFETSLGSWTASGGTSLYAFTAPPAHNYASTGTGAANLPKSSGTLTQTNAMPLNSLGYDTLTISFDYQWMIGTTTRRLNVEYAEDGVTFTTLGRLTSGNSGGNETIASASVTLTEAPADHSVSGMSIENAGFLPTFSDTAKFRFVDTASAGADVRVYVDNVVITATPNAVPEPSSLALLGVGSVMMMVRRRHG